VKNPARHPAERTAAPEAAASERAIQVQVVSPKLSVDQTPNLAGAVQSLQTLLKVERESRQAKTLDELWFALANECRRALNARQIFVLVPRGRTMRMAAISSLAKVERESPTVLWLEALVADWARTPGAAAVAREEIGKLVGGQGETASVFPFRHAMLSAAGHGGEVFAYVLAVREAPFGDPEAAAAERLSAAFGYAAKALGAGGRSRRFGRAGVMLASSVAAILSALVLIRTPMAVLAPAEVVARDALVVTAPLEGVIEQVVVDAGQPVHAGDALVRLADTTQRNQAAIAEQELAVAEAKWRQVSLAAFNDPNARRELTAVTTELDLKRAELNYAAEMLARMVIRADREGIAIFADKRELVGRPVQTGMRLMEIADPGRMRIRAMASVDDAMALSPGARLKLYPDADPLNAVEAIVSEAAHQARQTDSGALAFRVDADVPTEALDRLRIGHRGTAQITGERVSLGFFLLRRPLSALRQRFGL
jgi:multidrug resistance efflux pump